MKSLKRLDEITDKRNEEYENSRAEEPLPPGMRINGGRSFRTGESDRKLFARTVNEVVLDMSPFKVIRYSEGRNGLIAVFKKMIDLGFDVIVEDRKAWAKHFEESEYKPFDFDLLTAFTKEVHKP